MKISLIHPSRGRPQKAKATYDFWMQNASGEIEIEHILSLDFSDPKNEEYGMGEDGKYTSFGPNSKTVIDHNESVVEATNEAVKVTNGEVLVYLSDDFKCPKNWDLLILERVKHAGDKWTLRVNDGHQPYENLVLTIPIMSRSVYKHLGYFFNPLYKSMWVDCDLYAETKPFMIDAPDVIFLHDQGQNDPTYERSRASFEEGRTIFYKRQKQFNWPKPFNKRAA